MQIHSSTFVLDCQGDDVAVSRTDSFGSDELSAVSYQPSAPYPTRIISMGQKWRGIDLGKTKGKQSKSNRKQRKKGKNKRKQMAAMSCQLFRELPLR